MENTDFMAANPNFPRRRNAAAMDMENGSFIKTGQREGVPTKTVTIATSTDDPHASTTNDEKEGNEDSDYQQQQDSDDEEDKSARSSFSTVYELNGDK